MQTMWFILEILAAGKGASAPYPSAVLALRSSALQCLTGQRPRCAHRALHPLAISARMRPDL